MSSSAIAPAAPHAALPIPMEEYLNTSYHPDCDYVDGFLEQRHGGESDRSLLQGALGTWFYNRRIEWNIEVYLEQRNRVSGTRVRIPDICVTPYIFPRESVRVTPPILCIEILSTEDRINRTIRVLDDYLTMGVPHLWVLDPIDRKAFTYGHEGLLAIHEDRLTIPGSPIFLDLAELFTSLDERRP